MGKGQDINVQYVAFTLLTTLYLHMQIYSYLYA